MTTRRSTSWTLVSPHLWPTSPSAFRGMEASRTCNSLPPLLPCSHSSNPMSLAMSPRAPNTHLQEGVVWGQGVHPRLSNVPAFRSPPSPQAASKRWTQARTKWGPRVRTGITTTDPCRGITSTCHLITHIGIHRWAPAPAAVCRPAAGSQTPHHASLSRTCMMTWIRNLMKRQHGSPLGLLWPLLVVRPRVARWRNRGTSSRSNIITTQPLRNPCLTHSLTRSRPAAHPATHHGPAWLMRTGLALGHPHVLPPDPPLRAARDATLAQIYATQARPTTPQLLHLDPHPGAVLPRTPGLGAPPWACHHSSAALRTPTSPPRPGRRPRTVQLWCSLGKVSMV